MGCPTGQLIVANKCVSNKWTVSLKLEKGNKRRRNSIRERVTEKVKSKTKMAKKSVIKQDDKLQMQSYVP